MLGGYGTCGRPLCCTTFLHVVRAGLDQDGQAAGPEPEPVEAVGPVRPAEVLPALRAAEREGQVHGGCGSEGGCDNPTGCGTGGCGSGGCGSCGVAERLKLELAERRLTTRRPSLTDRSRASPSRRRSGRHRSGDCREGRGGSRACSRSASRSSTGRRTARRSSPGVLSAEAGRAAYDVIVRAVADAQRGVVRRDRDGAGQQGSVPARRPAVERAHRSARAPDRRARTSR